MATTRWSSRISRWYTGRDEVFPYRYERPWRAARRDRFVGSLLAFRPGLTSRPAASPQTILFYPSLSCLLSSSSNTAPTTLLSPLFTPSTSVHSLIAGASHFLLLFSAPSHAVLSYGDNRFSQLGVPSSTPSPPSKLHHVDFFEGLAPKQIAAGAFHSAVVGGDGALYMFGKGSEGQCGEEGGGEPVLIELGDGEEEVVSVGCGSGHTVIATDKGIWVTGSSESKTAVAIVQ